MDMRVLVGIPIRSLENISPNLICRKKTMKFKLSALTRPENKLPYKPAEITISTERASVESYFIIMYNYIM